MEGGARTMDYIAAFRKVDREDWWSVLSWLESVKKTVATKELVALLCGLIDHKSPHIRFATMQILLHWVDLPALQDAGVLLAEKLAGRFLYEEKEEIKAIASNILTFLPHAALPPLLEMYERCRQSQWENERLYYDINAVERFFQHLPSSFFSAILAFLPSLPIEHHSNSLLYQALEDMGESAKEAIPLLLERVRKGRKNGKSNRYLVRMIFRLCGSDIEPTRELLALEDKEIAREYLDHLQYTGKPSTTLLPYLLPLINTIDESEWERLVSVFILLGDDAPEAVLPFYQKIKKEKEKNKESIFYTVLQSWIKKVFLFFASVGNEKAKQILQESLEDPAFRGGVLLALPALQTLSSLEREDWVCRLASLLEQVTEEWEKRLIAEVFTAWGEASASALPSVLRAMGEASDNFVTNYLSAIRAMGKEAVRQAREPVRKLYDLQPEGALKKQLMDFLVSADGEKEPAPSVENREQRASEESTELPFEKIPLEQSQEEAVEEETKPLGLPFSPERVRFETRSMTIDLLLSRIKHNEMILQPDFQRGDVWSVEQKSRLIESLFLRIPLPSFYIDGSEPDRWQVIDGQQRLTAIKSFLLDDPKEALHLKGLEFFVDYEGASRDELPRHLLRRLEETQVTIFVVEVKMDRSLMFNIFKRINTGGLPLSSQEIRHALYQGYATRLLKDLVSSESFSRATGGSVSDKRMEARELILRGLFFFLKPPERWSIFRVEERLNQTMEEINLREENAIQAMRQAMQRAYEAAFSLFGEYAFRKPPFEHLHRRSPLNKAIFEVWVAALGAYEQTELKRLIEQKDRVMKEWLLLLEDKEFGVSISSGTDRPEAMKRRYYGVKELLEKVLS
jgi:hypothetical protein